MLHHMEKPCYTTDEMLRMIANTLVVYSYHIDNNGLTNGKMGVILFLYRYAAHTGNGRYLCRGNARKHVCAQPPASHRAWDAGGKSARHVNASPHGGEP